MLETPAAAALGNFYRISAFAPYSADTELAKKITAAYQTKYKETPQDGVDFGYLTGMVLQKVLEKACKDKNTTREGVLDAFTSLKMDTQGLSGTLDFSKPGQPATRQVPIERVDPTAEGGLKLLAADRAIVQSP